MSRHIFCCRYIILPKLKDFYVVTLTFYVATKLGLNSDILANKCLSRHCFSMSRHKNT